MDKFIKNKIIVEFEVAIRDLNDETLFKNIELLKSAAASDSQNDMCYQKICMELMQILTKEIKLKNKNQYEVVNTLSEDELCYLSSIYG